MRLSPTERILPPSFPAFQTALMLMMLGLQEPQACLILFPYVAILVGLKFYLSVVSVSLALTDTESFFHVLTVTLTSSLKHNTFAYFLMRLS